MINILERIDISKTNASKECDICHYWYFVDRNFKYESCPSNGSHELMQKAIILTMLLLFLLKEVIIELVFGI